MSRSLYCDDGAYLALYRQAVESAIKGKRGQAFMRDLATALDAMPVKRLILDELVTTGGEVCALGCLGMAHSLPLQGVDPEDHGLLARMFDVAESLIREVEFVNDDLDGWWSGPEHTPEQRWFRVRKWVADQMDTRLGRIPQP